MAQHSLRLSFNILCSSPSWSSSFWAAVVSTAPRLGGSSQHGPPATPPQRQRVADLRRRSGEHEIPAARSDQRRQLRQARTRMALPHRQPGPASGTSPRGHAADGQRRPLYVSRRHAPIGRRHRRGHRRAALGRIARTKASAPYGAPRQWSGPRRRRTGPTAREERILYVTTGYRLIALDAKTGTRSPTFGKNGVVDLKTRRRPDDRSRRNGEIGIQSAPVDRQGHDSRRRRRSAKA